MNMSDGIIQFLGRNGLHIEVRDKANEKLIAYRRNIYFPELLFHLGLSEFRQERFLIKIESQDQQIAYEHKMTNIKGCGMFFPFPVPTDQVMCAMQIAALLSRKKGRDFYDVMFLMSQTSPDYNFLTEKSGVGNLQALKESFIDLLSKVDLTKKAKDFGHLVFNKTNTRRILSFGEFVNEL